MTGRLLTKMACIAVVAASTACGGGGPEKLAGIEGTGVAVGTISGFGSIFVNGVHFETSSARITVNGAPGTQSDLRVGQVVRVQGRIETSGTTGTADTVDYDDEVKGRVTAFDVVANSITVLGQIVRLDGMTSLDSTLAGLTLDQFVGRIVEVSGFRDGAGVLHATRIEDRAGLTEFEVRGNVRNLSAGAQTFEIGSSTSFVVVDYRNVPLPAGVAEGSLVEARGTLQPDGHLLATRIERENSTAGAPTDAKLNVEGIVTRFAGIADFDVNGQRVTTSASTEFPDGQAGVGLNARVEAEGRADGTGVLVASRVRIRSTGGTRITGRVSATSPLRVFGVRVNTGPATRVEDKSNADVRNFTVANLNVNDWIETRGSEGAGPTVEAILLERRDLPSAGNRRVELRGAAGTISRTPGDLRLVVLGITVRADAGTECKGQDGGNIGGGCQALFDALTGGTLLDVDVRGDDPVPATDIFADEIRLENDD